MVYKAMFTVSNKVKAKTNIMEHIWKVYLPKHSASEPNVFYKKYFNNANSYQ